MDAYASGMDNATIAMDITLRILLRALRILGMPIAGPLPTQAELDAHLAEARRA